RRALLLVLDALGADPERGERGPEVVADGAEHPVLLVKEGDDAAVHRVEGVYGAAEVGGAARGDRGRRLAAAEALGGGGEVAQGTGEAGGDEQGRAEHDQIEEQGRKAEAGGEPRIGTRGRDPSVQPCASEFRREEEEVGFARPAAAALAGFASGGGADLRHFEAGIGEGLAEARLGRGIALLVGGDIALGRDSEAGAAAGGVFEHGEAEVWGGLDEV